MRPDNTSCESGHTGAEYHPSPPSFLHVRQAKLRQQIRGPTISPPGLLEHLHAQILDIFDAGFHGDASVVEQDGWVSQFFDDLAVELAHAIIATEIGLKGFGANPLGAEICYQSLGGGGCGVVMDCERAIEVGKSKASSAPYSSCCASNQGEMGFEISGQHVRGQTRRL